MNEDYYDKRENYFNKLKVVCPNCGHKVLIPAYVDSIICSWCNHKVRNNTKEYFKYKMRKVKERNEKDEK